MPVSEIKLGSSGFSLTPLPAAAAIPFLSTDWCFLGEKKMALFSLKRAFSCISRTGQRVHLLLSLVYTISALPIFLRSVLPSLGVLITDVVERPFSWK